MMKPLASILLLLGAVLWATQSWAILRELPLIGDPFKLSINAEGASSKAMTDAVKSQRQSSAEYKAIESAERAARFDRGILARWLESEGYFAHSISSSVRENDITHKVIAGPRYIVEKVTVEMPSSFQPWSGPLEISEGQPLRAEDVLASRKTINDYIENSSCLFRVKTDYHAEVNHRTHKAFIHFSGQDSPPTNFGDVEFTGGKGVDHRFLPNYLQFETGECFKRSKIEETRLSLLQSNLFARVNMQIAEPVDGRSNVTFDLTERGHRTLKAGISYDSDTELGALIGWEHRNLFHKAEHLSTELRHNRLLSEFRAELVRPHFRRKDQNLTLTSILSKETPDAYTYTSGEFSASLSRPLFQHWSSNTGLALEFSRDEEGDEVEDYALLSVPLSLSYNTVDKALNPSRGWAFNVQLRPFNDLYDSDIQFTKASVSFSTYLSASKVRWQPTLALRAALGSIRGETLDIVPSKHRYYVGGGGSVRGYRYQTVGLLEDQDDRSNVPVGGQSFGESAAELRLRFNPQWGIVLFVDGGFAYPDKLPNFGQDFLWGYGLGVRYFTSFAPIRFDIAAPRERRQDDNDKYIDDSFQLYISIGQAF